MNNRDNTLKYIEYGAGIITLATVLIAISGWIYLGVFYNYLGIELKSLNLNVSYYLLSSKRIIELIGITIFSLLISRFIKLKYYYYITFGIFCVALIYSIILLFTNQLIYAFYFMFSVPLNITYILMIIYFLYYPQIFQINDYYPSFLLYRKNVITIFIIFLVSFLLNSSLASSIDAYELISGTLLNSSKIKFEFKTTYKEEKIKNDIENKELIFIVFTNNNYYVVEENKNFNYRKDIPNVYILPKEEIKLINLKKIKN